MDWSLEENSSIASPRISLDEVALRAPWCKSVVVPAAEPPVQRPTTNKAETEKHLWRILAIGQVDTNLLESLPIIRSHGEQS